MSNFKINKSLIAPRKEPDDPYYDGGDIGVAGGGSQSSGGSSSNTEVEKKPSNDSFGDDSTLLPGTNTGANLNVGNVSVGRYVTTKNPRLSYFNAKPTSVSPSDGRDLTNKMSRLEFAGNEIPPNFHDDYYALRGSGVADMGRNIFSRTTEGARDADDTGYFRLGTFVAVIPPEYIHVSAITGANQISTLRGASPTYIKSNYASRTVTVKLFLNGYEGINGTEIDSPFGYSHYINGFRHLIGMFKVTPFVPVENTYLNLGHDILNVALIGITASTVEGFPNTLEVTLMLEEANLGPYIGLDALYDDFLIKPLFNFYVQRYIRDSTIGSFPMTRGRFVENLKIKMINPLVLEADDSSDAKQLEGIEYNSDGTIDLLNSKNYLEMIDIDEEKAHIVNMQISYNNEMPKVHMAGYETPVFQFIHGGTSSFSIEIETQNEVFISMLDSTIRQSLEAGREHAHKIGMGFFKIENEILALNGIQLALITEFTSETVPGFPGLFIVTLSGTGFDAGQRDREKFKAFRPFYDESDVKGEGWYEGRRGTRDDLITQSDRGMGNKVLQDACAEAKIMTTEMYPDLRLPRYSAVDWALGEIIKFYKEHNLSTDGIPTKLTRNKALIPGRGPEKVEYTGFADPDFYMSYPLTPADLDNGISGGNSRSATSEEDTNLARETFNSEMTKARDFALEGTHRMSPIERERSVKKRITSSDVARIGLLPFLMPLPIVPNMIKEPEYVPGFHPDEQIRVHHTHMLGNTFDEDGNLKDSTDMLIDKLNEWVRYSGGGSSYSFEDYEGSYAGDALLDQPGNNIDIPTQVKRVTGIPYIDLALNRAAVKCGYVYGSDTEIMTKNRVYALRNTYPKYVNVANSLKWVGRMCWDCSSFASWALRYMGYNIPNCHSSAFSQSQYPGIFEPVAWEDMQRGDVMYDGGHVAFYLGGGEVVHARGAAYGVMVNTHSYTKGGKCGKVSRVKNIETMTQAFLAANPTFYAQEQPQGPLEGNALGEGDEEGLHDVWQPGDDVTLLPGVELLSERGALARPSDSEESSTTTVAPSQTFDRSSTQVSLGTFPNSVISNGVGRDNVSAVNQWDSIIMAQAASANLDPNIVKAVIAIESSGNASASNSCCYGLMQINAGAWGVAPSDMLDPSKNVKQGCIVLDDYGKNTIINYDKDNWMRAYNAGIGTARSVLSGNRSWPSESINYAKKFDTYYSILLASGGHYGDRRTVLNNGVGVTNAWIEANTNGNEIGSGATVDGSVSSGGSSSSGSSSGGAIRVWFEREEEKKSIINKDLVNLFAGLIRSIGVVSLNISLVGFYAVASAISSLISGRSVDEIEDDRRRYDRKVETLYNKYQKNIDHERRMAKEVIDVTPPPYVVGTTVIVPPTVTVNQSNTSTSSDSPGLGDFSIGFVDNLSDKELKIDHAKVARQASMQNDGNVTEKMLVDSTEKALKYRLSKAFPSYLFMIVDEHDNWIDEKKFWSNYYIYQSLLSIDVSSSYNNPVTTARISMSNIYRNVKKFKAVKSSSELILGEDGKVDLFGQGDSEYSWFNQMAYKFTGSLFTEQITDEIVDIRNTLHDEVFIREGIRLHIRLGYGSNPANYSSVFNGNIYEVQEDGEIITVAAQSDGVELISNVLTDRTTATNKDLGLPEEGGDIIAGILCNRESEFMYGISDGAWAIGNTYGINHFGLYTANKGGWKAFRWEPTSYDNDDYTSTVGGLTGGVGHLEEPAPLPVSGIQYNKWWRRNTYEYDLIKNVYKCTYEGKYAFDPQILWFDGETNMRFMCNDKTPWDVFKIAEKAMCEFVAYPRIYGFEHRIFYGLPWWLCKFRYERDDRNQDVFEIAKSFSQFHMLTTETDIIDNKMVASSRGLVINLVGIYTLGSNLASTTVIMSDFHIDRSRQSTATIDTTSIQDNFKYLGSWINNSIEWIGALDNGRYNAIQICVSELIDNWLNTYKGIILTLGAPEVNVHDFVYLSDNYALIHGIVKVKDVVHSFNSNTGFTTSVYPGMVAGSRLHTSGFSNVSRSLLQVGVSTTAFITAFGVLNKTITSTSKAITAARLAWSAGSKAIPFLKSAGSSIVAYVKGAGTKIMASEMVTGLLTYIKGTAIGGKVGALVSGIGAKLSGVGVVGGVKAALATVIGVVSAKIVAIAVAIGALVCAVFAAKTIRDVKESFEMRNSIFVVPVTRFGYSFIAGANGQQKLIDMEYFQDMNGEGER